MNKRALSVALVLTAVTFAPWLQAQSVQFDLGLGYQWLNVSGNQDMQRTQTGDRDGFLLDSLGLVATGGKDGLYDRLTLQAAGIGASPDSRFMVQVDRARLFSVKLSYNRAEVFTALPGFANPFLASGVTPGQQTLDRRRDSLDLDLQLLPGGAFSPIVGYSRFHYWGPGRSTFPLGQDEFALNTDLDQTINEYRVGAGLALCGWRATVLQGWRSTDSSFDYALAAGAGSGNNSQPVLGTNVAASQLAGHSRTTGTAPFTNVVVNGSVVDRVRILVSYARTSNSETDADETFTAAGQFVSFALSRYFLGVSDVAAGSAKATNWRGNVHAEVDITPWLELVAGFTSTHRELDGDALLQTTYLSTVNFAGLDPRNVTTLLSAATAWDRSEDTSEAKLVARPSTWLSLWAAGAWVDQDLTIAPAAAEIVVPGGQGGRFKRSIDRFSAGADVTAGPVTLGADYQKDSADVAVMRTDYLDRDRLRGRAVLKIGSFVKVLASGERTKLKDPDSSIQYDAKVTHWEAGVDVTPIDPLTIHGGYDKYTSDSHMLIRLPQDFSTAPSVYAEDGKNVDGSASLKLGRFLVEAGANRYTNAGDLPFDLNRTYARFDVALAGGLGVYGQYERREYTEKNLSAADYTADRYGVFVRWASK
jgi:hypothetical protein